jgi:hypothetical protein
MSLLNAFLNEPYRDPKDIWVSPRGDGIKGTGTLQDAFNGSVTLDRALPANLEVNWKEVLVVTGIHEYAEGNQINIGAEAEEEAGVPADSPFLGDFSVDSVVSARAFTFRLDSKEPPVLVPPNAQPPLRGRFKTIRVDPPPPPPPAPNAEPIAATVYWPVAKVTVGQPHGFSEFDVVEMANASNNLFNGRFVIPGGQGNVFRFPVYGTVSGDMTLTGLTAARVRYLFDELMRSLPENIRIHLSAGVFETRGNAFGMTGHGWKPLQGWNMVGAGMDISTLRMATAYGAPRTNPFAVIGMLHLEAANYASVSDLTIDCNMAGNRGTTVGATALYGSHTRLRRVHAINWGTETPYECFVLAVGTGDPDVGRVDCQVEDCLVNRPWTNNVVVTTCLPVGFGGGDHGVHNVGCVARNNLIDGEFRYDYESPVESLTAAGSTATLVSSKPHGRKVNDWIVVSGALVNQEPDNPFNGSFKVTELPSDDPVHKLKYVMDSVPTATPTGTIFLGRSPSLPAVLDGVGSYTIGAGLIATLKTQTAHFRTPGSIANVSGVLRHPDRFRGVALNGAFEVVDVLNYKELKIQLTSGAETPTEDYPFYGGIGANLHGGGAAGRAAITEGNRYLNLWHAIYSDTNSIGDVVVRYNYMSNVWTGIFFAKGLTGTLIAIDKIVQSSPPNVALVTLFEPHGLKKGDAVQILNATGENGQFYNGFFSIDSVPDENRFTYIMKGIPNADASGSLQYAELWQVGRLVFESNVIELVRSDAFTRPDVEPAGMLIGGDGHVQPYVYRYLSIRKNTIRTTGFPPAATYGGLGMVIDSCEKGNVEDNTIDLPGSTRIEFSNSGSIRFFHNATPSGRLIQAKNRNTLSLADDLVTKIEDAVTLALL